MTNWELLEKEQKAKEVKYALICVALIILGFSFDVYVNRCHALITIDNIESISVAILQIHASVLTLTIAILALIGGRISDSYMGVKLNDFTLNKKPFIFKQKRIIAISFVILIVSVFSCMLCWYNLVVMLLLTGFVIIWVSISMIYDAFAGAEKLETEIEAYIVNRSLQNEGFRVLFKDFIDDWIKTYNTSGTISSEKYKDTFKIIFENLFGSEEGRIQLLGNCSRFATSIFREEHSYIYGIEFVQLTYGMAWNCIRDNKLHFSKDCHEFDLLNYVFIDLCRAIEKTPINEIETCFHWDEFIEHVIFVSVYMNHGENNRLRNVACAKSLAGIIGRYVAANRQKDEDYWGRPLADHYEYSVENAESIRTLICQCRLSFIVSLIKSGDTNLVKGFFCRIGKAIRYQVPENYVWLFLEVYCYCYYLAFYESDKYIAVEVARNCKMLLEDPSVQSSFRIVIEQVAFQDCNTYKSMPGRIYDVFNNKIEDKLLKDLYGYEVLPINTDDVKIMIIGDVIRDFSILLKLFISEHNAIKDFLENAILPTKALYYYNCFFAKEDCKEKIKSFSKLMGYNSDDKQVDHMYASLATALRKCYKRFFLNNIETINNKLVAGDPVHKRTIEKVIKKQIEKEFGSLIKDSNGESEQWNIMNVTVFTDTTMEESFLGVKHHIPLCFYQCLKDTLINNNKLEIIYKGSFKDDDQYLHYLAEKISEKPVVVGSEYTLSSYAFERQNEVDELINQTEHYLLAGADPVMVINKDSLAVDVKKVNVSFHNIAIEESGAKYVSEENIYELSHDGIPIKLSKDELEAYLTSSKCVLKIEANVSIETEEGIIGQIIINS